jgi:hypothetical protein
MIINETLFYEFPEALVTKLSSLVSVLQALGIVIVIYVVFSLINTVINRKRMREIEKINKNLRDIKKLLSKKK